MLIEKDNWNILNNTEQTEILKSFILKKNDIPILNVKLDECLIQYLEKNIHFDLIVNDDYNLEENIRSSIKMTFKLTKYVYEGEVTDIKKQVDWFEIDVMSSKETKTMKLPISYEDQLNTIRIGDVIYSEPCLGVLKRIGRCENKIDEFDLEGNKYVPLPKGKVETKKEKDITVSLRDIDIAYKNQDKADQFIIENSTKIEFKECLILIKTNKLTNKLQDLIKKYSMTYNWFKFILINWDTNTYLTLKLNDIDKFEFLKKLSMEEGFDKLFTDEKASQIIKKLVYHYNFNKILQIVKLSNNVSELERNMNIFGIN